MLFDSGCSICKARLGPVCGCCSDLFTQAGAFDSPGLDRCRAAFVLDDNLLQVITALKYRGERRVAKWLAVQLAPIVPLAADVITWVPTTSARRKQSGYDHGRELARAVSAEVGLGHRSLLVRHGNKRQTGRSRSDRHAGPELSSMSFAPDFVLVVDDVITTGSSLRIAADRLRARGATRVVGLTAAKTPRAAELNLA